MSLSRVPRIVPLPAALVLASLTFTPNANATVILGSDTAWGINGSLTFSPIIGPNLTVTVAATPFLSLAAPPPYNNTATAGPLVVPPVIVGAMTVNIRSDVDGLPGVRFAHADASVGAGSIPPPPLFPVFTFAFGALTSTADVVGDFGALVATGSSTFAGGSLTLPGLPPIVLAAAPAPNTTLTPVPGLTIILNEQLATGNGISTRQIDVHAVHIILSNVNVGLGTFNGSLSLGYSFARLDAIANPAAVPEPSTTFLMAGPALALIAIGARRRRPTA